MHKLSMLMSFLKIQKKEEFMIKQEEKTQTVISNSLDKEEEDSDFLVEEGGFGFPGGGFGINI